jgi:hypothetical protein
MLKGTTYYHIWTPHTSGGNSAWVTGAYRYILYHNDVARVSGTPTAPYNRSGMYLISIPLTGDNYFPGSTYNLTAFGQMSGYNNTDILDTFTIEYTNFSTYTGINQDVYYADVNLCKNDNSGADYYSVQWFKNGQHQIGLTSPTINVLSATGGNWIPSTAMPLRTGQLFNLATYNATGSQRLGTGERYVGEFAVTLDGQQRIWREGLYRDSNL